MLIYMLVLAFLLFVFVLTFSSGLLVHAFRSRSTTLTCTQVVNDGILGLATLTLLLRGLLFFLPLQQLLRPEVYVSFFGGALASLFFLRPKLDRLCCIGALLYICFGVYIFSSEIGLNSLVSFGGNGDFFNHQRMMTYLWNFRINEVVELSLGYELAQEYVGWGRYPIGSHILMSVFTAPFSLIATQLVPASWMKVFLVLAFLASMRALSQTKAKLLGILTIVSVLTLPLLQSVASMDFMSQLCCLMFIIGFCSAVFEKKHREAIIYLSAVIVVYYPAALSIVPLLLWWTVVLLREKKYHLLFLLGLLTLTSFLYYFPNMSSFRNETNGLGGLTQQFPFLQLIGLTPMVYGPHTWDVEELPTLLTSNGSGLMFRVVCIFLFTIALIVWWRTHMRRLGYNRYILSFFVVLEVVMYTVAYFFLPPYITYKFFTMSSLVILMLVLKVSGAIEWKSHKRLLYALMTSCIFVILVNLDQGYFYHNNPLRTHYQLFPRTPEYLRLRELYQDGTVLIHRNIAVTSLLSLDALDSHLYTHAFYFENYSSGMYSNVDQEQICEPSNYDTSKITQVLIEEGSCEKTKDRENIARHTYDNGEVRQLLLKK